MISNKINNITDWMNEGKIKNIKYRRNTTSTSLSLSNKPTKQGLFNNTTTLKGFKNLYNVFNNLGPYDVLDYLDSVWKQTTNDQASIDNMENHLLAVAVYFDFDQNWLNQYSFSTLPAWYWFNDIATNKKRPQRNRDLEELKYTYFRLYIISLMDN